MLRRDLRKSTTVWMVTVPIVALVTISGEAFGINRKNEELKFADCAFAIHPFCFGDILSSRAHSSFVVQKTS